jgi:hypothetical protein
MSTMKAIPADSYHISPIITHKTQQYTYTVGGGSNPNKINLDIATKPPSLGVWSFNPDTAPINPDGTFQEPLFASLQHLFYGPASVWNSGVPLQISGSTIYVVSIAQQAHGEGIKPGSFSLTVGSSPDVLVDNRTGGILVNGSGSLVGHIFYGLGIVAIQQNSGSAINIGGANLSANDVLDISFKATHTIYEHSIMCSMEIGDLNYTINPTLAKSTLNGEKVSDAFASGSLTPYMTTIGLYNNENQLVAVAKFPRAIKRAPESQQTVIIRWDV